MLISIHGKYFETVSFLLALSFSIGDNHGKAEDDALSVWWLGKFKLMAPI